MRDPRVHRTQRQSARRHHAARSHRRRRRPRATCSRRFNRIAEAFRRRYSGRIARAVLCRDDSVSHHLDLSNAARSKRPETTPPDAARLKTLPLSPAVLCASVPACLCVKRSSSPRYSANYEAIDESRDQISRDNNNRHTPAATTINPIPQCRPAADPVLSSWMKNGVQGVLNSDSVRTLMSAVLSAIFLNQYEARLKL